MDPKMDESEEEAAFLLVVRLAAGSVLPMALKSALELDLLHLIKKYGTGRGTGASASELAAHSFPQPTPMLLTLLIGFSTPCRPLYPRLHPPYAAPPAESEKTKKAFEKFLKDQKHSLDDALYGTFDIYLKAHPGLSKQERLFMVIESRKLLAAQKKWVGAC